MRTAIALLASIALVACRQESGAITDTDPFAVKYVKTPPSGGDAVKSLASAFARQHRMRLYYVKGHLKEHEYSLALRRSDLNIVVDDVSLGERSLVMAYARTRPTQTQIEEFEQFLCDVMKDGCNYGQLRRQLR